MGTFRSTFKPQYSASLVDRAYTMPTAAKSVAAAPAPKVEAAVVPVEAPKVRKAAVVSNVKSKPVSNGAVRIARWRAKQDPAVLKLKNREAVQRSRAKKQKTGKAVAS